MQASAADYQAQLRLEEAGQLRYQAHKMSKSYDVKTNVVDGKIQVEIIPIKGRSKKTIHQEARYMSDDEMRVAAQKAKTNGQLDDLNVATYMPDVWWNVLLRGDSTLLGLAAFL